MESPVLRALGLKARDLAIAFWARLRGHPRKMPDTSGSSPFGIDGLLKQTRPFLISAAILSGTSNVLMLSGSLFMLQVYDRVLPSHSVPTLIMLSILIVVVYAFIAGLDFIRSRIFNRLARYLDVEAGETLFNVNFKQAYGQASSPFGDLESIRGFVAGGGPPAFFDLPWVPLYVGCLFLLHPWIGSLGVGGIALLCLLAWRTNVVTGPLQRAVTVKGAQAAAIAETARRGARTIEPLGMTGAFRDEWMRLNGDAVLAALTTGDAGTRYGTLSRWVRMSLQSLVLALGALLVISGDATGGVMIAASILLGRALGPVELAISQWKNLVSAHQAWGRLKPCLRETPAEPSIILPLPSESVFVQELQIPSSKGRPPLLDNVSFKLQAGDVLAVVGPSGAGKSTLLKAIVGAIPIAAGTVQLDGSTLDQWNSRDRRLLLGYVPQEIELFAGSIARNIARFDAAPDSPAVVGAATLAGLDRFIRGLPDGYESEIGDCGARLSAGMRQRLALARALYQNPFLLVLDEPNSSLDQEGEAALNDAIRKARDRGAIIIAASHRPNVLVHANKILMLANGVQKAFGPREALISQFRTRAEKNSAPLAKVVHEHS